MANEWRELALTVPGTLREDCTLEEAIRLIDLAIHKLEALAEVLRAVRLGATYAAAVQGYVDPDPAGILPATLLEDARRDIKRRSTLQGQAVSVLFLCCEGMDLEPSAEMAHSCDSHSGDALENAADALLRLGNGAPFAEAANDAIDTAATLPVAVPLQRAWLLAAEKILNTAIYEVIQARNHVCKMRDALSLKLFDARSILAFA